MPHTPTHAARLGAVRTVCGLDFAQEVAAGRAVNYALGESHSLVDCEACLKALAAPYRPRKAPGRVNP